MMNMINEVENKINTVENNITRDSNNHVMQVLEMYRDSAKRSTTILSLIIVLLLGVIVYQQMSATKSLQEFMDSIEEVDVTESTTVEQEVNNGGTNTFVGGSENGSKTESN